MEFLWVVEVDESGRITAGVLLDADDWRAATREAWARWFARDAVAAASAGPVLEFVEAINEHDRTRLRATLADDFVLADHRPARLGLIEGAEAGALCHTQRLDALDLRLDGLSRIPQIHGALGVEPEFRRVAEQT